MKGLVEYLAKALVDNPAPVEVFEAGTAGDAVFRLKVARDDLGKVIGKKGRTAKAFRTLLSAAGAKQNLRVTLEILEPEPLPAAAAAPVTTTTTATTAADAPAPAASQNDDE
jgi:predicted RNA-binding protein YlqC (UPF0109 family)